MKKIKKEFSIGFFVGEHPLKFFLQVLKIYRNSYQNLKNNNFLYME